MNPISKTERILDDNETHHLCPDLNSKELIDISIGNPLYKKKRQPLVQSWNNKSIFYLCQAKYRLIIKVPKGTRTKGGSVRPRGLHEGVAYPGLRERLYLQARPEWRNWQMQGILIHWAIAPSAFDPPLGNNEIDHLEHGRINRFVPSWGEFLLDKREEGQLFFLT